MARLCEAMRRCSLVVCLMWSLHLVGFASAYAKLNSKQSRALAEMHAPETPLDIHNSAGLLEPILKVRLPGTESSAQVRKHLASVFENLTDSSWAVEYDEFSEQTILGPDNVTFTNVIATLDPPGCDKGDVGHLVLSAHYDSKLEPAGFIGAIDSALPCALILYVVQVLDELIRAKWANNSVQENCRMGGLEVIFFDGEEAFKDWTHTDSIYGARHLAEVLDNSVFQIGSLRRTKTQSIDVLVLLDLLGSPSPHIWSYFRETDWLHKSLGTIEDRLRRLKIAKIGEKAETFFPRPARFQWGGQLGDDHIPFLERGVPVLHLIPYGFPPVWHEMEDDGEHLDPTTIHDLAHIFVTFVAEYLELGSSIPIEKDEL